MAGIFRITVRSMFLLAFFSAILIQQDKSYAKVPAPALSKENIMSKAQKLRMPFIKNEGQANEDIAFYSKTFGGTVSITKDGRIIYFLPKKAEALSQGPILKEKIVNGNISEIKGEGRTRTSLNYFRGSDRSKWRTGVTAYDVVDLGYAYEGIGLKLKAYGNNVEKLFFIKPGADHTAIRLGFEGAKSIEVNNSGELVLQTESGPVRFTKPVAYQEINGKRVDVAVEYVVANPQSPVPNPLLAYGFKVGAYDKTRDLVIDPLLASTYIGGSLDDYANAIAVNQTTGDVYITGYSVSTIDDGFPISNSTVYAGGTNDIFIARFNNSLTQLLSCTYLGGITDDRANAIAIDATGNVYVAGYTTSNDFAGRVNEQAAIGKDAFVSKFNSTLTTPTSRYVGGTGDDIANAIAMDGSGNVYIVGDTNSTDLPVKTNDYTAGDGTDAFVTKLDSSLAITKSTYIGGTTNDSGFAVAVNGSDVYVAGMTLSVDLPLKVNDLAAGGDAFLAKLDTELSMSQSRYLGGAGEEGAMAIAISGTDIYIAGQTSSSDLPADGGDLVLNNGETDIYVSKLTTDLAVDPTSSKYFGGTGSEELTSMVLSGSYIYIGGKTTSSGLATEGAHDTTFAGDSDLLISKVSTGFVTSATTYIGSSIADYGGSIALDASGNVFISGYTGTTDGVSDFPTTSQAYDISHNGSKDAFVAKLDSDLMSSEKMSFFTVNLNFDPTDVHDSNTQSLPIANIHTEKTLSITNLAISGTNAADFSVMSTAATDNDNGNYCDTRTLSFTILPNGDCNVPVTFTPGAGGQRDAKLNIVSTWADGGVKEITLSGSGKYSLSVTSAGTGTGTVSASGISCGIDCSDTYSSGTSITLSSSASGGSTFTGWSGGSGSAAGCTGTGQCTFNITANSTLTATFTLIPVNGSCGTSGGQTFTAAPGTNLCGTGTASAPTDNVTWNWTCAGLYGGTTASCSAAKTVVNGSCGSSNNATLTSAPSANLCSTGTADTVAGTGPWTWNCAGINGGTTASCSASKTAEVPVNGSCGSSHSQTLTAAPSANFCGAGTASSISGSGPWTWSCSGINGGSSANCSAAKQPDPVNGVCGTSNGETMTSGPSTNLCVLGSASSLSGSGPWTWSCAGANGGATASCSASKQAEVIVDGTCGAADGQTLTAVPSADLCGSGTASSVTGSGPWTWTCSGSGGGATASCSANLQSYELTVTVSGTGAGTVTSTPSGIDCGPDCSGTYSEGAEVSLTAVAEDGSTFSGWSGGNCSGTSECIVTMTGNQDISAAFTQDAPAGKFNLTVIIDGGGSGEVSVNKGTMECNDNVCTGIYDEGASVTLTAQPEQGSLFSAWDGCDGTKAKCSIKIDDNKVITATFIPFPKLIVTVSSTESEFGTGTGKVSAAGIKCGNTDEDTETDCEQTYSKQMTVKLKAVPYKGSAFSQWEGCDSNTGNTCTVTVTIGDEDREVNAVFEATPRYSIAVTKDGNGNGKVTASQKGIDGTGINCDSAETDCGSEYMQGTTIKVVAQAEKNGSRFNGWSGYPACEGKTTPTCKVQKIDADVNLTASFIKPYNISGTVKDEAGIPLKGAIVTLSGEDIQVKPVKSNNKGIYTFKAIAPGTYTISASKTNYTFEDISVTLADSHLTGEDLTGTK